MSRATSARSSSSERPSAPILCGTSDNSFFLALSAKARASEGLSVVLTTVLLPLVLLSLSSRLSVIVVVLLLLPVLWVMSAKVVESRDDAEKIVMRCGDLHRDVKECGAKGVADCHDKDAKRIWWLRRIPIWFRG